MENTSDPKQDANITEPSEKPSVVEQHTVDGILIPPLIVPAFSHLSNPALASMAWFQVSGSGSGQSDYDHAIRQLMCNVLHQRGVLNKPELTHDSIKEDAFTEDELESFATYFELEEDEPSLEESFVVATLGHDRFKERSARPDSNQIIQLDDNDDNLLRQIREAADALGIDMLVKLLHSVATVIEEQANRAMVAAMTAATPASPKEKP
jgi:hypothetical protein